MYNARTRDDNAFHTAQSLREWDPADVQTANDSRRFRCPGCQSSVHAKSFLPNKRTQAHFAFYPGGSQHEPDCDCGPEKVAANKALIDADNTVPTIVPYPTRLIDPAVERAVSSDDPSLPDAADQRPKSVSQTTPDEHANTTPSSSSRSSLIGCFADAHHQMNDAQRRIAPIQLPGVADAGVYKYTFRHLPQWSIQRLISPRIFYGKLRFTAAPEDTGTTYRILLHSGEWNKEERGFQRPWTLVAHYEGWTRRGHTLFLDEHDSAVNQAETEGHDAWMYALAQQDPNNLNELHVHIRQRVAFIPRKPEHKT